MSKLRWGILGAANIARKNWRALFNSGNGVVTAVAARVPARAAQFVQECQALAAFAPTPRWCDSYEQLIAAPEVDAIYIPLPTAVRQRWVLAAARAGKHVLCEKPCAVNAAELREILALCRRQRVQFMDGVMFMHQPRLAAVREILADAARMGPLHRIESTFSFAGNAPDFAANIRVRQELEPAGCLGDLGWYCLRISLLARQGELPEQATGRILATAADGVTPTQFSGELIFADGGSAGFYCSFMIESQQWVSFMGGKATLRIADFVHPRNSYAPEFEFQQTIQRVPATAGTSLPTTAGELAESGHPSAQDTLMFRHFAAQVLGGSLNAAWPEIALKTQLVQDACLASARAGGNLVTVEKV